MEIQTVIINSTDYHHKLEVLLEDIAYTTINTDPTMCLKKTTKANLKTCYIESVTQRHIMPREKSSRRPKLYGQPKIHKQDTPFKPIVSAIGSLTHTNSPST